MTVIYIYKKEILTISKEAVHSNYFQLKEFANTKIIIPCSATKK
jgi:hypothetical protein